MSERRKTTRFLEKNNAVITFSIEKNNTSRDSKPAWMRDISIAGAKLLSHKSFPIDTKLLISLQSPKSKQIVELWARVVWVHSLKKKGEYEIGVKLIHSLQTMSNLFQHLYGDEVQQIEGMSPRRERFFPVDVAET